MPRLTSSVATTSAIPVARPARRRWAPAAAAPAAAARPCPAGATAAAARLPVRMCHRGYGLPRRRALRRTDAGPGLTVWRSLGRGHLTPPLTSTGGSPCGGYTLTLIIASPRGSSLGACGSPCPPGQVPLSSLGIRDKAASPRSPATRAPRAPRPASTMRPLPSTSPAMNPIGTVSSGATGGSGGSHRKGTHRIRRHRAPSATPPTPRATARRAKTVPRTARSTTPQRSLPHPATGDGQFGSQHRLDRLKCRQRRRYRRLERAGRGERPAGHSLPHRRRHGLAPNLPVLPRQHWSVP